MNTCIYEQLCMCTEPLGVSLNGKGLDFGGMLPPGLMFEPLDVIHMVGDMIHRSGFKLVKGILRLHGLAFLAIKKKFFICTSILPWNP